MLGKVNPTQSEALTMAMAQVVGNDVAVSVGGMNGQFQLNVFKPMMIFNFLMSADLISDACHSFAEHCIEGLEPNRDRIQEHLNNSLMLGTARNTKIGCDKAAEHGNKSFAEKTTLNKARLDPGDQH